MELMYHRYQSYLQEQTRLPNLRSCQTEDSNDWHRLHNKPSQRNQAILHTNVCNLTPRYTFSPTGVEIPVYNEDTLRWDCVLATMQALSKNTPPAGFGYLQNIALEMGRTADAWEYRCYGNQPRCEHCTVCWDQDDTPLDDQTDTDEEDGTGDAPNSRNTSKSDKRHGPLQQVTTKLMTRATKATRRAANWCKQKARACEQNKNQPPAPPGGVDEDKPKGNHNYTPLSPKRTKSLVDKAITITLIAVLLFTPMGIRGEKTDPKQTRLTIHGDFAFSKIADVSINSETVVLLTNFDYSYILEGRDLLVKATEAFGEKCTRDADRLTAKEPQIHYYPLGQIVPVSKAELKCSETNALLPEVRNYGDRDLLARILNGTTTKECTAGIAIVPLPGGGAGPIFMSDKAPADKAPFTRVHNGGAGNTSTEWNKLFNTFSSNETLPHRVTYKYNVDRNALEVYLDTDFPEYTTERDRTRTTDLVCMKPRTHIPKDTLHELALYYCQGTFNDMLKDVKQIDLVTEAVLPGEVLQSRLQAPELDDLFKPHHRTHGEPTATLSRHTRSSNTVGLLFLFPGVLATLASAHRTIADRGHIKRMMLEHQVRTLRIQHDAASQRLETLRLAIADSVQENNLNNEYGRTTEDNIRYSLYAERLKSDLMAALTILQQNINGAMSGYTTHSVLNNSALMHLSQQRHLLFNQQLTLDRSKLLTTAYFVQPNIVFTTRIPITRDDNDYTLYNVVGIPSATEGNSHQPKMSFNYYAFSKEDQSYIPLTRDEYARCTGAGECATSSPKQTRNFDCVASAFRNSTKKADDCDHVYYPRNKNFIHTVGNLTVYYFHKPTESTLKCFNQLNKGKSTVRQRTQVREGRGILHTKAGCMWILDTQNIGPGPSEYRADSVGTADTLAYDPHGFMDITASRAAADHPAMILGHRPWDDPIATFTDTMWRNPIQFATGSITPLVTAVTVMIIIAVLCCLCTTTERHQKVKDMVHRMTYKAVDKEEEWENKPDKEWEDKPGKGDRTGTLSRGDIIRPTPSLPLISAPNPDQGQEPSFYKTNYPDNYPNTSTVLNKMEEAMRAAERIAANNLIIAENNIQLAKNNQLN